VGYQLSKTIVLVGLMGAGKTAVGNLLGQKLGAAFLDSDHEIEKAANMSIAEIFTRDGEKFFRAKESQVLERLLKGAPCVLSTGGGAFMSDVNRILISKRSVAVWLKADIDLLWSRVRQRNTRPLLETENPYKSLLNLYKKRNPIYAKAEVVVESQKGLGVEEMASKVVTTLLNTPNSGVTVKVG
tara:strand:+ start:1078 stop:1632 length:555 start_codon:yes stop_codon:yes gene_type:complete